MKYLLLLLSNRDRKALEYSLKLVIQSEKPLLRTCPNLNVGIENPYSLARIEFCFSIGKLEQAQLPAKTLEYSPGLVIQSGKPRLQLENPQLLSHLFFYFPSKAQMNLAFCGK